MLNVDLATKNLELGKARAMFNAAYDLWELAAHAEHEGTAVTKEAMAHLDRRSAELQAAQREVGRLRAEAQGLSRGQRICIKTQVYACIDFFVPCPDGDLCVIVKPKGKTPVNINLSTTSYSLEK